MQQHDNTGGLWINKRKTNVHGDNKPHWIGTITIGGVLYRLAAWSQDGKGGKPVVAIKVQQDVEPPAGATPVDVSDVPTDDIPF